MAQLVVDAAHHQPNRVIAAPALACMGIVFGDIGTSPLYTLQVAVKIASPQGGVQPLAVIGVVSLIFWSLIVVISIKYAILIMRADNHGEGGILALLALVSPRQAGRSRIRAALVIVGLLGATLLYGDGCITPAISVLSALEGIKVYAPQTEHFILPLTIIILVALFLVQRMGTARIGKVFGPIMLAWFLVIALIGIRGILRGPEILLALSPTYAISYLWHTGPLALAVIGGAFLAVTGGEAFYADMGHFGAAPIRVAWFAVALPALTLNYLGQGGLLLSNPAAIENSFYLLAPEWSHYGVLILATAATVIASQAVISGAFSLTQQAIQLGFLPRMTVIHTAGHERGQIYMPLVNWLLACGTMAAVLGFGSSDALAGAYGIAVSVLMAITTLLATFVALQWKHNPLVVYTVNGSLFAIDLVFVLSASTKLAQGGWFPLLIAFVIAFLMLTWRRGEQIMDAARIEIRQKTDAFLSSIRDNPPHRLPGTAVVLGRMATGVPLALTRNVRVNRVLHQHVLLVAVEAAEVPHVPEAERAMVTRISDALYRVELRFGFMEQPDVPDGLRTAHAQGLIPTADLGAVVYYTGHETIIPSGRRPGMSQWRETIFAMMHHNAQRPGAYFNIPGAQVIEIGVEFVL